MNKFTVRVQLDGTGMLGQSASRDVYERLAENLAVWGIYDDIRTDDGIWFRMLDGDYNYEGLDDLATVFEHARTAALAIGWQATVFVTKAEARMWNGLKQIERPARLRPQLGAPRPPARGIAATFDSNEFITGLLRGPK